MEIFAYRRSLKSLIHNGLSPNLAMRRTEYLKTNETDCIYIDCPYGSIPQHICR